MKKMNYFALFCGIILSSFPGQILASYARVESMGKHSTFFMDDVSIFDNPANINVFPNFLIGEMGSFNQSQLDEEAKANASATEDGEIFHNPRYNRDPENPWFGGLFSYSLSSRETGNIYPQLSIGGAFNRIDRELYQLLPDSITLENENTVVVPTPVTNFDGFLGFTLANGGMMGSHIYFAMQEGAQVENGIVSGDKSHEMSTYLMRGDLGLNWPLARNVDGELSVGFSSVKFGDSNVDPQYSFFLKARSFSTVELINGELVPVFKFENLNGPGQKKNNLSFGIGVNASLDRGFFWLGIEGIFNHMEQLGYYESDGKVVYDVELRGSGNYYELDQYGGRISFGIERNIWWDWLVLRVGGQKLITSDKETVAGNTNYYIYSNPVSNGTPEDHVGFGIGINIEEKLKVDATVAEDFIYTGGNLLSGPSHHVISRISATYSF